MVEDTYFNRTQAVLVAIFFHYMGYLILLILDAFDFPKKVHITYGISKK